METSPKRTWDWTVAGLLLVIVLTASARLAATEWTTNLYFGEAMGVIGAGVGLALGASRFNNRVARWLGLGYTLTFVPWQLMILSESDLKLGERLAELGLRINAALTLVARGQNLDDSILFITFITLTFWLAGLVSGYRLARRLDILTALLPSGLVILIVQIYDSTTPARIWWLAFYLFLSLLLIGRVYYLENRSTWKTQRVFQMPETARDLSSGLMITAALVVITTWILPLSITSLKAATEFWREFVQPLRPIREDIGRALDPLNSSYGARGGKTDFYTESLALGRGLPLSDDVIFRVKAPEDLVNPPPRFYWRGRIFTTYNGTDWVNTNPSRQDFDSLTADVLIPDMATREIGTFEVTNAVAQSLIYSPAQPVWNNQSGEMLFNPLPGNERDLFSFQATPPLQARETYEVRAALVNPSIAEMQAAGAVYPEWVTNTYLQLPANFSPRIQDLARQIAADKETPYDKATAITQWLRANIAYQAVIPAPPANVDALEWVLFEYKQSFCVYYATGEVLMLRSLGVPARMAVGFAQGELDEETNSYTVLRKDYHAWPEVYFPGIGWVEFEPTPSQADLVRPISNEIAAIPVEQTATPVVPVPPLENTANPTDQTQNNVILSIVAFLATHRSAIIWIMWIAFLLALWGLDRRTGWVGRIPLYIEARAERNGAEPPRWVRTWAAWIRLSLIGRAYETINLSLRILSNPQPMHATPVERANRLVSLVPAAQARVKELTAQHERAVYAGGVSQLSTARKAAFFILLRTIQTRLIQLTQSFDERFSRPNSFR
jgi:transglutaminase-like putative cysteine protease